MEKELSLNQKEVIIYKEDLPLRCPPVGTPTYNSHPHQFFDILKTGTSKCPYCGTLYFFQGERPVTDEMYEGDNHVMPGT